METTASAAGAVHLRPLMIESPVPDLAEALVDLESAHDSDAACWMLEGTVADWGAAEESFGSQCSSTFLCNGPAEANLGPPLRSFCAAFLDSVQLHMHEQLTKLWSAVHDSPSTRKLGLQLAVTIMVSRKPADGEYRNELIHADAFDGTVIGLAFLCSKMGTRLFPDAVFVQAPVEQFINETLSGRRNGFSPVVPDRCGAMRTLQPGALLIIPAAVAHARPDGRVDKHSPAGPRWFARAHMELRPAMGRCAWDKKQRMEVALLVAQHVWRDAEFLANVMEQLELIPS